MFWVPTLLFLFGFCLGCVRRGQRAHSSIIIVSGPCTQQSKSGSLRTEPGTGEPADLEPEPAEPDTEPEPAEPEPEKMKILEKPKNQKKSKNPSKIKKEHPPTIQNQRITSPHPRQKREGWGPLGPRGPPLFFAGWGDVIL